MHGCLGADKRAGRLTKHGIDMDGGDEAAEAVAEVKRLLPTLPGHLSALRRSANLRNTKLLDASCSASRTRVSTAPVPSAL